MNSLFIGLGGAGCAAVSEFAKRIKLHHNDLNDRFVYIDTDEQTKSILDSDDFFIQLGENRPLDFVIRQAQHGADDGNEDCRRFFQWFGAIMRPEV